MQFREPGERRSALFCSAVRALDYLRLKGARGPLPLPHPPAVRSGQLQRVVGGL